MEEGVTDLEHRQLKPSYLQGEHTYKSKVVCAGKTQNLEPPDVTKSGCKTQGFIESLSEK